MSSETALLLLLADAFVMGGLCVGLYMLWADR